VKKNINDKTSLLEKGVSCLEAKHPSAAISAFQKALQLDPFSAGAYSGIGQAFLDLDEFQGAEAALSKSVELAPTPCRYVLLAYALAQLGRQRKAFRAYKNALRMSPANDEALFNAAMMLKGRHPKVARDLLTRAVNANPNCARYYLELGMLLNRTRRFQEAKSILETAMKLNADDVWIRVELANALWRIGEENRAEEVLGAAARKFPGTAAPLWTLASYLEIAGRTHDAGRLFKEAADREPTDKIAQRMLADFQERQNDGDGVGPHN
jgi:tetratricopeptide (TPR) repeat protein